MGEGEGTKGKTKREGQGKGKEKLKHKVSCILIRWSRGEGLLQGHRPKK